MKTSKSLHQIRMVKALRCFPREYSLSPNTWPTQPMNTHMKVYAPPMSINGSESRMQPNIVCVFPRCVMNLAKMLNRPKVDLGWSISGSKLPKMIKIKPYASNAIPHANKAIAKTIPMMI